MVLPLQFFVLASVVLNDPFEVAVLVEQDGLDFLMALALLVSLLPTRQSLLPAQAVLGLAFEGLQLGQFGVEVVDAGVEVIELPCKAFLHVLQLGIEGVLGDLQVFLVQFFDLHQAEPFFLTPGPLLRERTARKHFLTLLILFPHLQHPHQRLVLLRYCLPVLLLLLQPSRQYSFLALLDPQRLP